jgi:glycopeptide antibiotics resistance protein
MTNKQVVSRRITLALFILYVLAILFLLIIPNNYRGHNVLVGGLTWERWLAHMRRAFSLVPLRSLSEQVGRLFAGQDVARGILYLVGNLVGFAPLGYFLPVLFARQRKFPMFLLTTLLAIAVLELVQAMTLRGSCDMDDLILNTAGACAGFWIMRRLVRRMRTPGACRKA